MEENTITLEDLIASLDKYGIKYTINGDKEKAKELIKELEDYIKTMEVRI